MAPRSVQEAIYRSYWNQLSAEHPSAEHPSWDEERLRHQVGTFVTLPNDPRRIPPHATGGAVDLTLTDADGVDLDMGTDFDHFRPESATLYFEGAGADPRARDNRRLLREAMDAEDFRIDDEEWWHFDYGNQVWVLALDRPTAIYGELAYPPISEDPQN